MITLNPTSSAIFICLLTIVCLITNQFKAWVLLIALRQRDHPRFSDLIGGGGAKFARSLARNIPEQICYGIPRTNQWL